VILERTILCNHDPCLGGGMRRLPKFIPNVCIITLVLLLCCEEATKNKSLRDPGCLFRFSPRCAILEYKCPSAWQTEREREREPERARGHALLRVFSNGLIDCTPHKVSKKEQYRPDQANDGQSCHPIQLSHQ
jgi:hypothetical protein